MAKTIRVMFDKERKLVAKHRHIRDAVLDSKRSIGELMNDPFGGYPYVIKALIMPSATITLDDASDLIDAYLVNNKPPAPPPGRPKQKMHVIDGLTMALTEVLQNYLQVEVQPTEDEKGEDGVRPNADSPDAPGHSAD